MSLERFTREQINIVYAPDYLTSIDSVCEVCGEKVKDHSWVDLDVLGNVADCSREHLNIGERYDEEHIHDAHVCMMTHKRNINGKVYLFSRVATPNITQLSAYQKEDVFMITHSLGFTE